MAAATFAAGDLAQLYKEMGPLTPPDRKAVWTYESEQLAVKFPADYADRHRAEVSAMAEREHWPDWQTKNALIAGEQVQHLLSQRTVRKGTLTILRVGERALVVKDEQSVRVGDEPERHGSKFLKVLAPGGNVTVNPGAPGVGETEGKNGLKGALEHTLGTPFAMLAFEACSPKMFYDIGHISSIRDNVAVFQDTTRATGSPVFWRYHMDVRTKLPVLIEAGSVCQDARPRLTGLSRPARTSPVARSR